MGDLGRVGTEWSSNRRCWQSWGPPPPRLHKITKKGTLTLVPSTEQPPAKNQVTIEVIGADRVITANGIPDHKTGKFPDPGNPNPISEQKHVFKVPAKPALADRITAMRGNFSVAINGVTFDPGAGEFYDGAPGWQYEPLSGAIAIGLDLSHARVQPTGKYHYHGLPAGVMDNVKVDPSKYSPQTGWAADGFPIYAVYGYTDPREPKSAVKKLTSSYRLKQGNRPGGDAPGEKYDGTFVADYEYATGNGDLDECNGRFTVTPEYPEGTYAYFLTENWPVVPRNFRGTPSADFTHGGPPGEMRPGGGPPVGPGGPGGHGPGDRPRPGQLLLPGREEALGLSADQRKKLDALQKSVNDGLAKILTPEQLEKYRSFRPGPPGGRRLGQGLSKRVRGRSRDFIVYALTIHQPFNTTRAPPLSGRVSGVGGYSQPLYSAASVRSGDVIVGCICPQPFPMGTVDASHPTDLLVVGKISDERICQPPATWPGPFGAVWGGVDAGSCHRRNRGQAAGKKIRLG